jgi:hypothetical protein
MTDAAGPEQRVHLGPRRRGGHVNVSVCDGCCCGTTRKHPEVDHAEQRRRIAAAVQSAGGSCRVVGCVDECHASNVIVVRWPRSSHRALWLGGVLDERATAAVEDWLSGGADPVNLPAEVSALSFERQAVSGRRTS